VPGKDVVDSVDHAPHTEEEKKRSPNADESWNGSTRTSLGLMLLLPAEESTGRSSAREPPAVARNVMTSESSCVSATWPSGIVFTSSARKSIGRRVLVERVLDLRAQDDRPPSPASPSPGGGCEELDAVCLGPVGEAACRAARDCGDVACRLGVVRFEGGAKLLDDGVRQLFGYAVGHHLRDHVGRIGFGVAQVAAEHPAEDCDLVGGLSVSGPVSS
jgi:hypothetical protein